VSVAPASCRLSRGRLVLGSAGEDVRWTAAGTAALQSTAAVLLIDQMNTYAYLIAATVGYLLGSIPFGYLLVRLFKGEDVRTSGSGNIGATNVARKSPVLGVATLLLDAVKGLAAVLVARVLFSGPHQQLIMTTAAFFAVLGHLFPLWLKFRGGKGVATSLGAFILLTPKSILCMVVLFLLVAVAFRYVSLGSVAVAAAFPLLAWALHEYVDPRQLVLIALVSALVIWRHRQNIGRLATGTESKLGRKLGTRSGRFGATRQ
jgi:glycerol-3-phosphate acyltransferase PlsY